MFQFTREFIINDLNGKLKAKSNEHISSTLFGTNNKGRFAITKYKKDSSTVKKELMIDPFTMNFTPMQCLRDPIIF